MSVKSCSKRLKVISESSGRRVSRFRRRVSEGRPCSLNWVPVARVMREMIRSLPLR